MSKPGFLMSAQEIFIKNRETGTKGPKKRRTNLVSPIAWGNLIFDELQVQRVIDEMRAFNLIPHSLFVPDPRTHMTRNLAEVSPLSGINPPFPSYITGVCMPSRIPAINRKYVDCIVIPPRQLRAPTIGKQDG